jgi:hypothetical protein
MRSFWYPECAGAARFAGTLAVSWAATLLFVGFYHFFARHRSLFPTGKPAPRPTSAHFPIGAYFFVLAGLTSKIYFVHLVGGLHYLLVSRSAGIATRLGLSTEISASAQYFNYFSLTADAAACWLFLSSLRARKSLVVHSIILAMTLTGTFIISPKREVLVIPLFSLLVGFSIYLRPLKLSQAPVFLVSAVSFSLLTLFGRIFVPAYFANVDIFTVANGNVIKNFVVRLLSADNNYFDATGVAIYGTKDILAKFGGWWSAFVEPNILPLTYFMPRAFWPSKPEVYYDLGAALRAIQIGTPLRLTEGGNGISLTGSAWVYGGPIGLIIGMALLAWAACQVDRFLLKMHYASPVRILVFAISATMLFLFYRQGTIGFLFLDFAQTALVFWLTVLALAYLSAEPAERQGAAAIATGASA